MLGGIVRGKGVVLRTTNEADLADHLAWHADFDATAWMPRRPWPQSLEQRKEWLAQTANDRAIVHWELEADGAHAGYCGARLLWPPMSESWSIETFFVAPSPRRRGARVRRVRPWPRRLLPRRALLG